MVSSIQPSGEVNTGVGTVVDPTKNVLDLVEAAVKRLDDLSNIKAEYGEHIKVAEIRRLDDLAELRAQYHEKLAIAEAKRIDAIRSVDVNAVAVASERATQQAQVLATQVAQSADALRALVATTADTFAKQQQSLQTQITERLSMLERSQYESKGKAGVEDPRMIELIAEVKALRSTQNIGTGKSEGVSASWGVIVAVIASAIAVGSFVMSARKSDPAPAAQPPIIYLQPGPTPSQPIVIQPSK